MKCKEELSKLPAYRLLLNACRNCPIGKNNDCDVVCPWQEPLGNLISNVLALCIDVPGQGEAAV